MQIRVQMKLSLTMPPKLQWLKIEVSFFYKITQRDFQGRNIA